MHPHWKLLHPLCSWSGYGHWVFQEAHNQLLVCMESYGWSVRECGSVHCTHHCWTNEWDSQAGAQSTNLLGSLICHWNNWKYGAGNFRFPHRNEFIRKLSTVWACAHGMFHKPCHRLKISKNVSFKVRQIISLSKAPLCLEPTLVHMTHIKDDSLYRTGIWKSFIFLQFSTHMTIWVLYVIMW